MLGSTYFAVINNTSGFYSTTLDLALGSVVLFSLLKVPKVDLMLKNAPRVKHRTISFYIFWVLMFAISFILCCFLLVLDADYDRNLIITNAAHFAITIQYIIAFRFIILVEDLLMYGITGTVPAKQSILSSLGLSMPKKASSKLDENMNIEILSSVHMSRARDSDVGYDENGAPLKFNGQFDDSGGKGGVILKEMVRNAS